MALRGERLAPRLVRLEASSSSAGSIGLLHVVVELGQPGERDRVRPLLRPR